MPLVADTDLISAQEAARIVGCSLATLHRRADAGKIPTAYKGEGLRGARLFERAEVERYAETAGVA